MFKAPFSFSGRIRRLEYRLSYIIFYAYLFIVVIVTQLIRGQDQSDIALTQLVLLCLCIPAYWFLLAQGAKRCHDRGNSGWYQIIPFYVFLMVFADGFPGPNEYGYNPKGIGNHDEINEIGSYLEQ